MGTDNLPEDPFTGLGEAAVTLHEMYLDLRRGGFSMLEGCVIIAFAIRGVPDDTTPPADPATGP